MIDAADRVETRRRLKDWSQPLWETVDQSRSRAEGSAVGIEGLLALLCIRMHGGTWHAVTQARVWHEVEERLGQKWGDFDAIQRIAQSSFQHQSSFARAVRAIERLPLPEDGSTSAVVADVICQVLTRLDVASGKLGDLVTPDSLVRCMVELADPHPGQSVHDPFCRSGEFLARTARKLDSAGGQRGRTTLSGVSPNEHHWRLSSLIAVLGLLDVDLGDGPGDALLRPKEKRQAFDIVVTNPPFNVRHTELPRGTWIYGDPPQHNANFAWLQHAASLLKDDGRAVVLMPNSAGVSEKGSEATIRAHMIQAGVVECVVALPPGLFRSTTIPVSIWILRGPATHSDKRVLLVDATGLGTMIDRVQRVLTAADIGVIVDEYRTWTQERQPDAYRATRGFARSASEDELRSRDYGLNPLVYVEPAVAAANPARTFQDIASTHAELSELRGRAHNAWVDVIDLLDGITSPASGPVEGGLPSRWSRNTLGELCEIQAGPGAIERDRMQGVGRRWSYREIFDITV